MGPNARRFAIAADGFNDVSIDPVKGGFAVTLSHSGTDDDAATVFVPEDKIVFWYGDERGPLDEEDDDALDKRITEVIG